MLYRSCPCTNITIAHTHRLMHTIINATLLTLCHCGVFRPSVGHLQGLRQIHYHSKVNKQSADVPTIRFRDQRVTSWQDSALNWTVHFVTECVDPEDGPLRAETRRSDIVLIILCISLCVCELDNKLYTHLSGDSECNELQWILQEEGGIRNWVPKFKRSLVLSATRTTHTAKQNP